MGAPQVLVSVKPETKCTKSGAALPKLEKYSVKVMCKISCFPLPPAYILCTTSLNVLLLSYSLLFVNNFGMGVTSF